MILNVSLTGQTVTNDSPVSGADTINGGDGNDTLHGGEGIDTINGGNDDDTIVDRYSNTVNGGAGNDLIVNVYIAGGTWDGGTGTDTLDISLDLFSGETYDLSGASFVMFGATFLNFENVIDNEGGNTIIGSDGVNVLTPNGGDDTVDARGGNDTIIDTDGVNGDSYNGGDGTDTLNYSGATIANGTEYNFLTGTITSGASSETISNIEILIATGADEIIRSDGTGEYYAGGGNDIVYAGWGLPETLDGGSGTDTLDTTAFIGNYVVNLTTGLTNYLNESFSNFENLISGPGSDTLTGTSGDNVIEGGAGADLMDGGLGNDTLSYAGSNAGVTVNLAANTASGGHATGDTFSNFENALGSAHADTIDGSTGANVLSGGGSSDILRGGDGNDTLNGDAGNDFLYGQNDNDTLNGGEGNDTLNGQTGADTMTGGNGNDTYFLDNAGDVVNEAIGTGVDTTDTVITSVNFRQDLMTSALGVEYIVVTGTGNVTIVAMETFNVITGNSGNNYIAGYGGNDTIDAGAGTDFVFGGDGRDLLTGGLGNDTFYYSFVADSGGTINRRDTITDFGQVVGNDDVIDLRALDAISFNSGLQHFTFIGTAAFSGALGQLRYFYDAVNNLTIIEGNTFGDTAPEFQLALVGNYTLTAGAAGLGHDILIV
ncbi:MAG: calcium-binding protein [Hyphomicrobiaceae bacterium]